MPSLDQIVVLALLALVTTTTTTTFIDAKHTPRRRHHQHGHLPQLARDVSPTNTVCSPKSTSAATSTALAGAALVAVGQGYWEVITTSIWVGSDSVTTTEIVSNPSANPTPSSPASLDGSSSPSISSSSAVITSASASSTSDAQVSVSTPSSGISASQSGTASAATAVTSSSTNTNVSSNGTSSTSASSDLIVGTITTDPVTTFHNQKHVVAHFMIGIVSTYKQSDWEADIRLAKSKGITGFACNIGVDWYTEAQLDLAFLAAAAVGDFGMFISFDFNWYTVTNVTGVASMMQRYIDQQAHMKVDGKPFVSSFIGDTFPWSQVATTLGREIYAVPFWQPTSSNAGDPGVSGLFSWAAWSGQLDNVPVDQPMDDSRDLTYLGLVQPVNKVYMAPVSSWFSTHFGKEVPYSKNWVFKSETLWFDRWQEILSLNSQLDFIELVTWNDYGESHYIGPYDTPHTDDGSSKWAAGMDHTAMLDFAVPYINAFKSGLSEPVIETEMLVYWHRPHLKAAECDSTDNVGSRPTGWDFLSDSVFVASMTKAGGTVTVTSGSNAPVTTTVPAGVHMMEIPMGTGQQQFEITTSLGVKASGVSNVTISANCWNGIYNYNYNAGSVICG